MFTQSKAITPLDYSINYGLNQTQLAYEIGISQNSVARYFLSDDAKSKIQPDHKTLRIIQLLDFIKQNGLEPPHPLVK